MTLRKALLAATVLALPVAAQAQPVSGLYVGAGAGANYHLPSGGDGSKLKTDDVGIVGLASIGWGFGNGLRAEVEGSYRHNDIRSAGTSGNIRGTSGYFRNYGAMANVLFDIPTGTAFTPYIGAGAGYIWTEVDKANLAGPGAARYRIDDTDGNFAYQGIAGVAYAVGGGLSLTAEARFLGTLEPSLSVSRTSAVGPAARSFKPDNYNASALLGLRYAFNTPAAPMAEAAPPVAPAAPAVARTYLVFFDWDRADLTDRARQIIGEAAGGARRVSATKIEVAGHADRSGTPQYNQRLSERRAQAVAAELVRQGVARNDIGITAFGESRPLVPTADGVREPQNRRVEIVLR